MTDHLPPLPRSKAEFLEQLEAGRRALWEFIDALTPEQLTAKRDAAGWSIKDHLIHLAVWESGLIALLRRQPRYAAMGLDENWVYSVDDLDEPMVDAINARIFEQHYTLPTEAVITTLRRIQGEFSDLVALMSADDLLRPYRVYQRDEPGGDNDAPVLDFLADNTTIHYAEHLPWMKALTV